MNGPTLHIAAALFFGAITAGALATIVRHCLVAKRTPIGRLIRMKWRAR